VINSFHWSAKVTAGVRPTTPLGEMQVNQFNGELFIPILVLERDIFLI
jgi:hypothetical protein